MLLAEEGNRLPKLHGKLSCQLEARTCFTEIMRGEIKTVGTLVDWFWLIG